MRTQQGLRATKPERQRRIARLIAERMVTSQQELVELLAATGQPATQATVSRDLEELGAYKVRRNGHVVYALPPTSVPGSVPGHALGQRSLLRWPSTRRLRGGHLS